MNKLTVVFCMVWVAGIAAGKAFPAGYNESFEGYADGASIAGAGGWNEAGVGDWFEARATTTGDPAFLGSRYGDLSNNGNGASYNEGWVFKSFTKVTTGLVVLEYDALFQAAGASGLDGCYVYLSDGDRTPAEYDYSAIATGVGVDTDGLRVYDNGWRVVDNFAVTNDTWYHFLVTANLDAKTYQVTAAQYTGDVLGGATTVSYSGVSTFGFRDPTVDDIGMAEFMAGILVMNDTSGRGFFVDNIQTPEPATGLVLLLGGLLWRRKNRKNALTD
jgi:hypothetical protein